MPKLFIVRHAIAEDREVFKKKNSNDDLRPLTKKGMEKIKLIAKKFRKQYKKIDVIFQSPLLRSQQTADVLKKQYPKAKLITTIHLRPGSHSQLLSQELKKYSTQNIMIVGHEPHLSQFLNFLITKKSQNSPFEFKKGGIACLEFHGPLSRIHLEWMITPKLFIEQ